MRKRQGICFLNRLTEKKRKKKLPALHMISFEFLFSLSSLPPISLSSLSPHSPNVKGRSGSGQDTSFLFGSPHKIAERESRPTGAREFFSWGPVFVPSTLLAYFSTPFSSSWPIFQLYPFPPGILILTSFTTFCLLSPPFSF
uniref:Uncharacterized protein n=1 Tax=Cacopsylla melanoneura TaxID=428564 RepID=A0A8D8QQ19_9HEMI